MNILFLSYWGIAEGLTAATVIPHLHILDGIDEVGKIFFITIERDGVPRHVALPGKVVHMPLTSGKKYLQKVGDFIRFPAMIQKTISSKKITFMFCKGSPAGALGYLVHKRTGIEYAVESLEPHAEYMLESGVWKKWGFRYNVQRWWESKQTKTAHYLLPVAGGMKALLISQGVEPDRIHIMPCAVDHHKFRFNQNKRDSVRSSLQISPDCVVGIYVGKFGGLYYDEEAFDVFKYSFDFFENFRLIILTPDNAQDVHSRLLKKGLGALACHVVKVEHGEVPDYLSAADLAFALIKPSASKKFASPIKIGEYWSVGLPVLITEGIGEDSHIISLNKAGATFRLADLQPAFTEMRQVLNDDTLSNRTRIRELALRYRNFERNEEIYRRIIQELVAK
jgi:hypothetical protein